MGASSLSVLQISGVDVIVAFGLALGASVLVKISVGAGVKASVERTLIGVEVEAGVKVAVVADVGKVVASGVLLARTSLEFAASGNTIGLQGLSGLCGIKKMIR